MANTLKLPVGIENFEEIRKLGFYYIDKTRLIEQLLQGWGKVTLFTRPRRFGKTLNMSMLRSFLKKERTKLYLRAYTFPAIKSCVTSIWGSILSSFFHSRVWMV